MTNTPFAQHTPYRLLILLVGVCLLPATVQSEVVSSPEYRDRLTQYRAVTNNQADAEETARAFSLWHQQHPTEHLIGLYRGALDCLIARDAWFPWNKMRYANRCIDQMDHALMALEAQHANQGEETANADLLHAYVERGFVNSHLPSLFGRKDIAIEDFQAAQAMTGWSQLPKETRQAVIRRLTDIQSAASEAGQ